MGNFHQNVIYAILVFLVGIGTLYVKHSNISQDIIEYNSSKNSNKTTSINETHFITIHLAGAVTNPGVYKVIAGTRILDVIYNNSNTLDTANLDKINLAKIARDGQRIYVPYKAITQKSQILASSININTATSKQLQKIPGIGKKTAKELVDYRNKNGFFYTPKDILKVKYIGTKMLQRITPYITI